MEAKKIGNVLVVKFSPTEVIDAGCVRTTFEQNIIGKKEKKIVVDLSGIDRLDSIGIGLIVSGHVLACVEEAKLVVAGAKPRVQDVLRMTSLDKLLILKPSVEDAVETFK